MKLVQGQMLEEIEGGGHCGISLSCKNGCKGEVGAFGERKAFTILCVRLHGSGLFDDASVHIVCWGVKPKLLLMCTRGSLYL